MADVKVALEYELNISGADKFKQQLGSLSGGGDDAARAMQSLQRISTVATAAVVAGITAIVIAANKLGEVASEIQDVANALNISTEAVQGFKYVAEQTGGSIDTFAGSIRSLNTLFRGAANANSEQALALRQLGLDYNTLIQMRPEDAFLAISDAVGRVTDETQQNILAATVFGQRYGTQVVGALNDAGGSLRTLMDDFAASGNALSGEQVQALDAYSDAMKDLEFQFQSMLADALTPILPALQSVMQVMADAAEEVLPVLIDNIPILTALIVAGTVAMIAGTISSGALTVATTQLTAAKLALAGACTASNLAIAGVAGAAAFAAIEIVKLINASKEATEATEAGEEAERRAAQTNQVAIGILDMLNRNQNISTEALEGFRTQLQGMPQDAIEVQLALQNISNRLSGVTNAAGQVKDMMHTTSGKINEMNREQILAAISANMLTIQILEQNAALANGSGKIDAQIQRLRDYNTELKAAMSGATTPPPGGSGASATPEAPAYMPQQDDAEFQAWSEAEMQRIIALGAEQGEAQAYSFQEAYAAAMSDAQPILDAEHEAWQSRYDLAMDFSRDITNTFVQSWDGGFEDLDKMFKKMLEGWVKELLSSGILSAFSTAFGGGTVGIFGKLFGGEKK